MERGRESSDGRGHRFGGDWTSQKLAVLQNYLEAYTKALRQRPSPEHPFHKVYIDAFAGTGYREPSRRDRTRPISQVNLFPDLAADEPQALLDGSATLALKVEPSFQSYVFIESSQNRCTALERLRQDFPDKASGMFVHKGDANEKIRELCTSSSWESRRAVLFLDPYGMQVEWATIEAVARTRAIDMWLLFPLGIGVNRLLTKSGEIPPSWQNRLDLLLGTHDWYDEFYEIERTPSLFGGDEEHVVKASVATIGRYFNKRLESIFEGVAPEPGVLRNSANCPLYLLCFAASNPNGAPIALRIASSLLKKLH